MQAKIADLSAQLAEAQSDAKAKAESLAKMTAEHGALKDSFEALKKSNEEQAKSL